MKRYYTRTFVGMGVVLGVLMSAALLINRYATLADSNLVNLQKDDVTERSTHEKEVTRLVSIRKAMEPVYEFKKAWANAKIAEKDAAEKIRADIEAIAQRQLQLVTDSPITPQAERYVFQGIAMRIQRVSLRASGKDLAALMTWLGKVEERYPAASFEMCEYTSNVGGNTALTIRFAQPLQEAPAARPLRPAGSISEASFNPQVIGSIQWLKYLPKALKEPVAVGFQRNPIQPAIVGEHKVAPLRDDSDEITPKLAQALEGHLRSVIRGEEPMIMVDGRAYRAGDEVLIGPSRARPIEGVRTTLKAIQNDHLVFQVVGISGERSIRADVAYRLPPFLRDR